MTQTLRNLVDGQLVDGASGRTYDVVNPSTGQAYATAPASTAEDVDRAYRAAAAAFGRSDGPAPEATTALRLARAASPSPAALDTATVEACARDLSPAAIVEVVTWLSVLEMLHRLTSYVWPTD